MFLFFPFTGGGETREIFFFKRFLLYFLLQLKEHQRVLQEKGRVLARAGMKPPLDPGFVLPLSKQTVVGATRIRETFVLLSTSHHLAIDSSTLFASS